MVWQEPEQEQQGGPLVVAEGVFATTLIATPGGWRLAGDLRPGTQVLTFDAGTQCVTQVHSLPCDEAPADFWPLRVPCWAMDNRDEVILLPEQKVLIEADVAEDLYGDPFALIPARALEGWRGIERCRPLEVAIAVQLSFARHQVIYASRGVLLSCGADPFADSDWRAVPYSSYSLAQAQHLIACLMAEETGAALRSAEQRRFRSAT
ncbi:Hint domain-containing protein [Pseudotabrizicola sp.]|uniref:Hint domain-containing protein n=1 Tax=Pseudotabrizicola sp. TaxID=2939647 RepID=UPI002728E906|nr:Hint domain-containing protein [Pseudotabrizicola sp.]MDO8885278.1 Hint domain-containing protein [Pseudotabrizicola sp.]MDP2079530.1 Hint domain-containing protein [Pseudotabrizicola sp.]